MSVVTKTVRIWRNAMLLVAPISPAIPYRTDSAISGGTVAIAIIATACVLAAFIAILMYGRQRGWIATAKGKRSDAAHGIELQSSRRLSALSTAHVICFQGNAYLIVESARGSSTSISPITQTGDIPRVSYEAE